MIKGNHRPGYNYGVHRPSLTAWDMKIHFFRTATKLTASTHAVFPLLYYTRRGQGVVGNLSTLAFLFCQYGGRAFLFWVCAGCCLILASVRCCDHFARLAKASRRLPWPVRGAVKIRGWLCSGDEKGGSGQNWSGEGSMVMLGVMAVCELAGWLGGGQGGLTRQQRSRRFRCIIVLSIYVRRCRTSPALASRSSGLPFLCDTLL